MLNTLFPAAPCVRMPPWHQGEQCQDAPTPSLWCYRRDDARSRDPRSGYSVYRLYAAHSRAGPISSDSKHGAAWHRRTRDHTQCSVNTFLLVSWRDVLSSLCLIMTQESGDGCGGGALSLYLHCNLMPLCDSTISLQYPSLCLDMWYISLNGI